MKYDFFKLDEYISAEDWSDRQSFIYRLLDKFLDPLLSQPPFGWRPLRHQNRDFDKKIINEGVIETFCDITNLKTESNNDLLNYFNSQIKKYYKIRIILGIILVYPIINLIVFGGGLILGISDAYDKTIYSDNFYLNYFLWFSVYIIGGILIVIVSLIVMNLFQNIYNYITRSRFADAFSLLSILYLLIELYHDDVLLDPRKKISLQLRINNLSRNISFLQNRYASKNKSNQDWSKEHFHRLSNFVNEREKWVISPNESTLDDLRTDFYLIAKILASGNYGEFKWEYAGEIKVNEQVDSKNSYKIFVLKFVGLVLPLLTLLFLIFYPQYLPNGVDVNLVTLIFISWLLITIDSLLKLGVIAGIVNLAKEIKNLQ